MEIMVLHVRETGPNIYTHTHTLRFAYNPQPFYKYLMTSILYRILCCGARFRLPLATFVNLTFLFFYSLAASLSLSLVFSFMFSASSADNFPSSALPYFIIF